MIHYLGKEAFKRRRLPRGQVKDAIRTIAIDPSSTLIAACSLSTLFVFDSENKLLVEFTLRDKLNCIAFIKRNSEIVGGGRAGLSTFSVATGEDQFFRRLAECLSMDISESHLGVCGLFNYEMQFFDEEEPAVVLFSIRSQGPICCVSLSADGSKAVCCSAKNLFYVWDVKSRTQVWTASHSSWVWACIGNQDFSRFLSCEGRNSCKLSLWEYSNPSRSAISGATPFKAYAVSRDFSRALFACEEGELRLLNLLTREWASVFKFHVDINDVCFSWNSRCAVGLSDGSAWLVDLSFKDKERMFVLWCAMSGVIPEEVGMLVKTMLCWDNRVEVLK